ncbi:hypothetical protein O181_021770 [Austropuccinia psidii MF-1]|uniref:CCHC-type domain-containing protein n=1 Tax=Austropuccinia psidii MF-1 TaxID=1389203 RepID=A0A9Q3CG93_9BASI|nr:hypothetical protein [Austropuccinia psidii MF-1]
MEARSLLTTLHNWTPLADPNFITSPTTYPSFAHFCLTEFEPEEENLRKELFIQKKIDSSKIHTIQWLGHPKDADKSHCTLLITLTEKLFVPFLLAGGLVFNGTYLRSIPFQQGKRQCFNCLRVGHQAHLCKLDPICLKCGKPHHA